MRGGAGLLLEASFDLSLFCFFFFFFCFFGVSSRDGTVGEVAEGLEVAGDSTAARAGLFGVDGRSVEPSSTRRRRFEFEASGERAGGRFPAWETAVPVRPGGVGVRSRLSVDSAVCVSLAVASSGLASLVGADLMVVSLAARGSGAFVSGVSVSGAWFEDCGGGFVGVCRCERWPLFWGLDFLRAAGGLSGKGFVDDARRRRLLRLPSTADAGDDDDLRREATCTSACFCTSSLPPQSGHFTVVPSRRSGTTRMRPHSQRILKDIARFRIEAGQRADFFQFATAPPPGQPNAVSWWVLTKRGVVLG